MGDIARTVKLYSLILTRCGAYNPLGATTQFNRFNLMTHREAVDRCRNDLYFLITEVLYSHDVHKYGPLHKWMCGMAGKHPRELWLLPRDHFKSTILTVGYSVQQILRNPGISILLLSGKDEHALGFSKEIRNMFVYNQRLKELFPPWAADREFDSVSEWETPAKRHFNFKRREATMVATGSKSRLASKHYNLGLFDDCMDEDDITEAGLTLALANFRKAVPLIDVDGQIIACGTRKHYNDLYQNMMASGAYKVYARHGKELIGESCDNDECKNYTEPHWRADYARGTPIEPKRYDSLAFAQKLKECKVDPKKGEGYFWHEYMNLPFSPGERKFQPAWFVKIQDNQIPGKTEPFHALSKWITLDTAWKDDEHPSGYDFTVMIVGGFDDMGRLYILDILRSREWTEKQGIEAILTAMQAYGISRVITEKAGETTIQSNLREAARLQGVPIQVITVRRGGRGAKGKFERIMASQYNFERGRVFFRECVENFDDCVNEFCNLGNWTNDDIADAIAMFFDEQVKKMPPPANQQPWTTPRPMGFEAGWRHAAHQKADPLGRFGTEGPAITTTPIKDESFSPYRRIH